MSKCQICEQWNERLIEIPFNGETIKVCGCECFLIYASRYYDSIVRPQPAHKNNIIPMKDARKK